MPQVDTQPGTENVEAEPVGHGGIRVDIKERDAWHKGSGLAITMLLLSIVVFAGALALVIIAASNFKAGESSALDVVFTASGSLLLLLTSISWTMLTIISPGQTSVRQFFGRYVGTVRSTGINLVAPFTSGEKISVKVHNFETNELKVNDSDGNPINIAAIVVWQVADTAKASFAV